MPNKICTPLEILEPIAEALKKYPGHFAIAGGISASFYRLKPRFTNDLDIAFSFHGYEKSKKEALTIIEGLKWKAQFGWIDAHGKRDMNSIALIVGKQDESVLGSTVDFLLPTLPWVEKAVWRAQKNLIDFRFAHLPVITPEDVIIAKVFALELEPTRFNDLDDIKLIFCAENDLDIPYLVAEFEALNLKFPKLLSAFLPAALRRFIYHYQ